jgi:ribosomal protein S3
MNCRVSRTKQKGTNPKKKGLVQIHLGYVRATSEGQLVDGDRKKLTKKLREHWQVLFGNEDVEIDWADAEIKWVELRARLIAAELVEQSGSSYDQPATPAEVTEP